jgi:hypothetical protein
MQLCLAIGGFLVVVLFAGVLGGLAIVARRLGSLISLHHHLAGGTNNKDAPKKGASGKPRRLTSPARRNRQRD